MTSQCSVFTWEQNTDIPAPARCEVMDFDSIFLGLVIPFIGKDGLNCIPKKPKTDFVKFQELLLSYNGPNAF